MPLHQLLTICRYQQFVSLRSVSSFSFSSYLMLRIWRLFYFFFCQPGKCLQLLLQKSISTAINSICLQNVAFLSKHYFQKKEWLWLILCSRSTCLCDIKEFNILRNFFTCFIVHFPKNYLRCLFLKANLLVFNDCQSALGICWFLIPLTTHSFCYVVDFIFFFTNLVFHEYKSKQVFN